MKHLKILLPAMMIIAVAEFFPMILIRYLGLEKNPWKIWLDALLLILISAPFIYFLLSKAISKELTETIVRLREEAVQREQTEEEIHSLNANLSRSNAEMAAVNRQLQETQLQQKALLDSIPDIAWLKDRESRFIAVNRPFGLACGVDPDDLPGKTDLDIWPRELAERYREDDHQVMESGRMKRVEEPLVDRQGLRTWIETIKVPILGDRGQVIGTAGIARDITERNSLEEVRSRLAAIVESSDDAIVGKTLDGIITNWNKGAERLYGYTAEEALGRNMSFLVPPEHVDEVPAILEKIRNGESIGHHEAVRMDKDGRHIDVFLTISPIKDAAGKILGASVIAHDITKRKRMEEDLRRSHDELEIRVRERTAELEKANEVLQSEIAERRRMEETLRERESILRSFYDSAAFMMGTVEIMDGDILHISDNEATARFFKTTPDFMRNRLASELGAPAPVIRKWIQHYIESGRTGRPVRFEYAPGEGDDQRWMSVTVSPIYSSSATRPRFSCVTEDITERKRAERQISKVLKMLAALRKVDRSILDGANVREIFGVVCEAILEMGYRLCWVGLAEPDYTVRVGAVRGVEEEAFAHLDIRWDDTLQGRGPSGTVIKTGQTYVSNNILENIRFAPWRDKVIEWGLRSVVSLPLKSPESDVFGVLHVYSEQENRFSPEEIHDLETLAQQCSVAIMSVQSLEALRDAHQRLSFHVSRMPLAYIVWDGEFRVVEWNLAAERIFGWKANEALGKHAYELIVPEDAQPHVGKVWSKLLEGDESSYSLNANIREDRKKVICEWFNTPLRDRSGNVIGGLSMVNDVTEKTQLEKQLQTAQRMEAVGTLAGGIAHDFNNALTGIFGFAELLRQRVAGDGQALHDLDEIMRCSERASTLTRQLLTYARRQVIEPVNLSLNILAADLMKLVAKVAGEHIEVKTVLAEDLPTIYADRGQIEQVLMNLCLNARDAMPEGGKLLVETENVNLDEEYVRHNPYMRTGRFALLRVSDTGIGMDEKTRERVFEPFFTTKGPDKGTGLGLAMVYGIVKQHDGFIHLYSEPGRGTTFKVYFPAIQALPDAVPEKRREKTVRGGTETILLAEDEEPIRLLAERTLKEFGYNILVARDGEEAIEIFRRNKEIVLVVLDVVMPRKGGKEAFQEMQKENPRLKVIFMSGYSANAIHESFVLTAGVPFLQKPFGPTILARKIREVLDTPG